MGSELQIQNYTGRQRQTTMTDGNDSGWIQMENNGQNDSSELQMAQTVVNLTENKMENYSIWLLTENKSSGL